MLIYYSSFVLFPHLWICIKSIHLLVSKDPAEVCIPSTNQHNEFVCLGTVEDAVGSDSFPELFVNVVIFAAVDKKTIHRRVSPCYSFGSSGPS